MGNHRVLLVVLIALLLLPTGSPGAGDAFPFPVKSAPGGGLTDTQARLPVRARGYYNLDAFLTVFTHQGSDTAGYFWSQQFDFPDGDGGYMGLQTNGRDNNGNRLDRSALFSIFDNRAGVPRGLVAAGDNCRHYVTSGGDGEFVSCIIPYDWREGDEYRIRTWALGDAPNNMRRWGGWVQNVITGREEFIGAIDVPRDWGWLGSYANAFVEHFGPAVSACHQVPYTFARWRRPTANNGRFTSAVGTHPGYPAGYGRCNQFSRAYTLNGSNIYSQTGFGDIEADVIRHTIRFYYRSGLDRLEDASGFNYWYRLVGNRRNMACARRLEDVGRYMLSSPEFLARWTTTEARVDRLYLTLLQRRPDATGRAYWIQRANALGDWARVVQEFVTFSETRDLRLALCRNRNL